MTAGYETETESSSDTEGHRSKKKKGRKAYKPDNKRMNDLAKAFVKNNKKCSTMLHFQMNLEPWLSRTLEQEGINVDILDPVQGKKLPDEGLLVAKWRSELWNLLDTARSVAADSTDRGSECLGMDGHRSLETLAILNT